MNLKEKWWTEVTKAVLIITNPYLSPDDKKEPEQTFQRLWCDLSAPVEWHKEYVKTPFGVLIDVAWNNIKQTHH